MKIAFRCDASTQIGTGHVMRCLTLADALAGRGDECLFLCRPHQGHLIEAIASRGHGVSALPALTPSDAVAISDGPAHAAWLGTGWERDARDSRAVLEGRVVDWLVVDHYGLDARWETALRDLCRKLLVIDDLADRTHDCDLLIDQNLGRRAGDYAGLLPVGADVLAGPGYALLRPEFAALRAESLARRAAPQLRRLLITMGGIDKDNVTGRVLDALDDARLPENVEITAVMGANAPWLAEVEARAAGMRHSTRVLVGVSDMARLMTDSDLAIGAAGGTSWERCCLGLPCLLLVLADNQRAVAEGLQQAGAALVAADGGDVAALLQRHIASGTIGGLMAALGGAAAHVCDGCGTARIVGKLAVFHA